jgi:hypothetical protein
MGKKRTDPRWGHLREVLWTRSGGFCEISGWSLDFETFDAHHRRPKGIGGTYRELTDSPANLLALLPLVHNIHPKSVHGAPAWSRPRGYLLPGNWSDETMLASPVLYRGHTWMILQQEGELAQPNGRAQAYYWRQLAGELGVNVGEVKPRMRGSQYR